MFKWLGGLVDSNEKEIKRLKPIVERINKLEPEFKAFSDAGLKAKTAEFKERISQATSDIRKKLENKRKELAEARACLAATVTPFDRDEQARTCKLLEEDTESIDKQLGEQENKVLDEILPEAFAAVREAARRTIGQRHYDVQLMGGIILHQGKIAEMKTGEGKTIVATLPLYLNALTGRGVHLVTVNDYLARRDPYWYGPVYHALGLKVASIYPMQTPDEMQPSRLFDPDYDSGDKTWPHFKKVSRKEAYLADITYGQSSEFGFDYLRDNMVIDLSQAVQRPLNFAVVDEVDNLLIDEARTPLIISGQREESLKEYDILARIAPNLKKDVDYKMNEKGKGVDEITEEGFENAERLLKREGLLTTGSMYDEQNANLLHHLRNAIVAKEAYQRDKEYVVKDGEVIIVDEFTGRLMLGRRYEGGLHQAIEAKEHVAIQKETMTYATITIQNYFRMFRKLGGMTGTAVTEAEEFSKIYNLEVVTVPTNKPMVREDSADKVYKTEKGKFNAVVAEVAETHEAGRPVLLGTASIEKSEVLSNLLKRHGIAHEVLNAKQHEREAGIIAQAGRPGAVTVATNMAGRGVDIILGGTPPSYHFEQDLDEYIANYTKGFNEYFEKAIINIKDESLTNWKNQTLADLNQKQNEIRVSQVALKERAKEYLTSYENFKTSIDNLLKEKAETQEYEKEKQKLEDDLNQKKENFYSADNLFFQKIRALNDDLLNLTKKLDLETVDLSSGVQWINKITAEEKFNEKITEFNDWIKRWALVKELGGLHVIGTERHEARRIDNQLRGRAGRQGDPGSSRFFVSLEDDLMRRFGGDRIKSVMEWAGMDEETAIENSMVSKSIENAQVKVEGYHFDMRKHLVDYDDVVNKQREIIYNERRKILSGADLKANILTMVKNELKEIVERHTSGDYEIEPDYKGLIADVFAIMPLPENFTPEKLAEKKPEEIADTLAGSAENLYNKREAEFGADAMRILERLVMLRTMDNLWIEHLTAMEGMREGIGLEAIAQRDPLVTYKTRGHEMFEELMSGIQGDLARTIFHMAIRREPAPAPNRPATAAASGAAQPSQTATATTGTATTGVTTSRPAPVRQVAPPSPLAHVPQSPMAKAVTRPNNLPAQPTKVAGKKVGRNDPCPCGSGKKYKHCCGK